MNQKKRLKLKKNIEMEGRLTKAICGVEIYNTDGGKIEVILCEPDCSEYGGISTTNYFEHFATKIKSELLADTPNRRITWIDRQEYHNPAFKDRELCVAMDFDGSHYSNPRWGRRKINESRSILSWAKRISAKA